MKNIHKTRLFRLCIVLIVLIVVLPTIATATIQEPTNETIPQYQVNECGLTYGSGLSACSFETEPDLIRAMGENGIVGYVYAVELRGPMPSNPEEAIELMAKHGSEPRFIPLYESDGQTVIGRFIVGGGERIEYCDEPIINVKS